jgi:hypothetical protein
MARKISSTGREDSLVSFDDAALICGENPSSALMAQRLLCDPRLLGADDS